MTDARRYPAMIYHYPQPLGAEVSGSQVHVAQLRQGFIDAGYEVIFVSGWAEERAAAWKQARAALDEGRVGFLYAFSPTTPTLYNPPNRPAPLLDLNIFRTCRAHGVPVGVFYGDVYWKFAYFRQVTPRPIWVRMIPLFWYDWLCYLLTASHLFLPSLRMAPSLPTPWPRKRMSALAPGWAPGQPEQNAPAAHPANGILELFYVGGVVPPMYDMCPLLIALNQTQGIHLTLCCRQAEWEKYRDYYAPQLSDRVTVVHAERHELAPFYARADLFALYFRHPYRDFAMPVKLMEAVGYGVPIIDANDAESGRFVAREGIGWAVDSTDELAALLAGLQADRSTLAVRRAHLLAIRNQHTWQARAEQVAATLLTQRRKG
jgi:hypothetical protein